MATKSLRGTRIGTQSMETDQGVELAPRQYVRYEAPDGTFVEVPLALEADVPDTWEMLNGDLAVRVGVTDPETPAPAATGRKHWDMLIERRSREELEVLLQERLELLRAGKLRANGVLRAS